MTLSWLDTSPNIEALKPQLAILPLASLGGTGVGFPQDVNARIVMEIARRAASKCSRQTFLLPCWPYGTAGGSTGIHLGYKTLWAVVKDIVDSLFQHDVHQVAVINDLGTTKSLAALPSGNEIIKTCVRQLNYENPGLQAVWIQPFRTGRDILKKLFPAVSIQDLDGVTRASMLQYLWPSAEDPYGWPPYLKDVSAVKGEQALAEISDSVTVYIERSIDYLREL